MGWIRNSDVVAVSLEEGALILRGFLLLRHHHHASADTRPRHRSPVSGIHCNQSCLLISVNFEILDCKSGPVEYCRVTQWPAHDLMLGMWWNLCPKNGFLEPASGYDPPLLSHQEESVIYLDSLDRCLEIVSAGWFDR